MKKWDGYSLRGVLITALGLAGIGYEVLLRKTAEMFVVVMYGLVVFLGILLILIIRKPHA